MASMFYLVAAYFIFGFLIDELIFPHDFPNKFVPVIFAVLYLLAAGVGSDHAWFGVQVGDNIDHYGHDYRKRAKIVAMIFFAVGLVINYSTVAILFA